MLIILCDFSMLVGIVSSCLCIIMTLGYFVFVGQILYFIDQRRNTPMFLNLTSSVLDFLSSETLHAFSMVVDWPNMYLSNDFLK